MAECADYDVMSSTLAGAFGEVSVGYGLRSDGHRVLEMFVSQQGTWTLISIAADGMSCVVAVGTNYVFVEHPWPNNDQEG